VAHVVQGIAQLPLAERPAPPVGVLRAFVEHHAEQLLHHAAVADLIGKPGERCGDLRVDEAARGDAVAGDQQAQVLAGRVRHHLDRRIGDQGEQRGRVDRQGVYRGHLGCTRIAPRHLHEGQLGDIAVLGHELEVDGELAGLGDRVRDLGDTIHLVDRRGLGSGHRCTSSDSELNHGHARDTNGVDESSHGRPTARILNRRRFRNRLGEGDDRADASWFRYSPR
jgi:hypothetical protein